MLVIVEVLSCNKQYKIYKIQILYIYLYVIILYIYIFSIYICFIIVPIWMNGTRVQCYADFINTIFA